MIDVYDTDPGRLLPDGRLANPPIKAWVETFNRDSLYIHGPRFEIILENRSGTPVLVIWNRPDDSSDPDMVFFLDGKGDSNNYVEVNAPPEEE